MARRLAQAQFSLVQGRHSLEECCRMMIETGGIVFLSLAVLMWRLPRKTMLWFFGHPAWLEVPFSGAVYLLHYGTFSGMISAATAACLCFCFVQMGRWLVGYTTDGKYVPGYLTLDLTR
jgi:hypothetical protein